MSEAANIVADPTRQENVTRILDCAERLFRHYGYGKTNAVLLAALPSSLVGSVSGLLWPVLAIGGLGLLLVVVGGVLLGNYISAPISELEDGLLAIINGQSDLRFQLEHPELGGLVFRINSLLNAMMGVAEDTTDDQGRPSQGPSAQGFQDPG